MIETKKKEKEKDFIISQPSTGFISKLLVCIKRDYLVVVVLLIALFACLYTINQSITIQEECINTCRIEWCKLGDDLRRKDYSNEDINMPNLSAVESSASLFPT